MRIQCESNEIEFCFNWKWVTAALAANCPWSRHWNGTQDNNSNNNNNNNTIQSPRLQRLSRFPKASEAFSMKLQKRWDNGDCKAGVSNTRSSGRIWPAILVRPAKFWSNLAYFEGFRVNYGIQMLFSNKLWPAEHFFIRMWPSHKFEFAVRDRPLMTSQSYNRKNFLRRCISGPSF